MGGTNFKDQEMGQETGGSLFGLRELREAKGIGFKEIVKATKVSPLMIETLEGDDFSKLPEPVYVRAFLKEYARAIKVDEGELLQRYESLGSEDETGKDRYECLKKRRSRKPLLPKVASAAFAVFLVSMAFYFVWDNWEQRQPVERHAVIDDESPAGRSLLAVGETDSEGRTQTVSREDTPPLGDIRGEGPLPASSQRTVPSPMETVREGKVSTSQAKEKVIEAAVTEGEDAPAVSSAVEVPDRLILEIRASELTWIQIVRDGEKLEQMFLQPGVSISRTAEKGFEIIVGNAGGAEVFFQGSSLGSLGGRGEVVSLTLPQDDMERR